MTDSGTYYDSFMDTHQIQSGINDRIFNLFQRVVKAGIQSGSTVFEIGCGIGCLTFLLSRIVKKGTIEAIDISHKSVDFAKKHIKSGNIRFSASDVFTYKPFRESFDFIMLFDVIEHVPEDRHKELFQKLSSLLRKGSKILINIPNPEKTEFDTKHHPEGMQEIDQPIYTGKLSPILSSVGLKLRYLETYSIWNQDDYIFMIIEPAGTYDGKLFPSQISFMRKCIRSLQRMMRRFLFSYP